MSAGEDDVHRTTGADIALAEEDRELASRLVDVIDDLDTLDRADLEDEYERKYPSAKLWNDEPTPVGPLAKKYRPAALDLPSFGEAYDGSQGRIPCGTPLPHVCKDGHVHELGRTCGRSVCPRCGPAWVTKRAKKIVQNIWAAAKMMDGATYKHHAVLSPPPEILIDEEDPEKALIDAAQDFMREIGMEGIAIYHPWSGKDAEGIEDAHDDDDRGEWKKRLFSNRDWNGDVREELQHRPHVHLIGACNWFPGGDVIKHFYEETGWVAHRITEHNGSAISLSDIHSVARAVTYALSHCGIDTRGDNGNRYVHGKVGSKYHGNDGRHEDKAAAAVHAVVPETLGIPSMEVSCRDDVPEEDRDSDHLDDNDLDDLEDGDGSSTDDDGHGTVTCNCELHNIDDADFVEDEEWQASVVDPEPAMAKRQEWKDAGGWQQWQADQTGQSTLPDVDPPD